MVDPIGNAFGEGVPGGRRRHGKNGSRDAEVASPKKGEAPLPLLRVSRPGRARLLAAAGSAASRIRRRACEDLWQRGGGVLRDDGCDRRRDGAGAFTKRRADRAVGPWLRAVAAVGQLQFLARRSRLSRAQGRRAAKEPGGALLARALLGRRRLVQVPRLLDGLRRSLCQSQGPRGRRDRLSGQRVRGASGSDLERALELTDPKTGELAVSRVFR